MSHEESVEVLRTVLAEVQGVVGGDAAVDASFCPRTDLGLFDSLIGVEVLSMIDAQMGQLVGLDITVFGTADHPATIADIASELASCL